MPVTKAFLLILFMVFMAACDPNRAYEDYTTTGGAWHKDSLVSFSIAEMDTTQNYHLFIQLRNNNHYPFSNIFLITEFYFPTGNVLVDTLEYRMAAPDGTWLGQGFSDLKESKLWYKENVRFPDQGVYQLKIRQAVRKASEVEPIEVLSGITDVGLRIEKTQNKNK